MTREEAEKYIGKLTLEEKLKLNAMLSVLEQERQPSQAPVESDRKA